MLSALEGWPLVTVIVAGIAVAGFLIVLLIMREGRSRKVRVGVFVEREYLPEEELEPIPPSEWPTKH